MRLHLVVSDDSDAEWLDYTATLLSKFLGLKEPLVVLASSDLPDDAPAIFYGVVSERDKVISIPRLQTPSVDKMCVFPVEIYGQRTVEVFAYVGPTTPVGRNGAAFAFDVIFNVFAYVSCLEEWLQEVGHQPIHSYGFRASGEKRRFDRPYADFMVQSLRRQVRRLWPELLFGQEPQIRLMLTHDVDLIRKTVLSRTKDGVFRGFNALRHAFQGNTDLAWLAFRSASRVVFRAADYMSIPAIVDMEEQNNARSVFNVFPGPERAVRDRLAGFAFDPRYNLAAESGLLKLFEDISRRGWEVGAHFGFTNWRDGERILTERRRLQETLSGQAVQSCRQHWFRFSLRDTWAAQAYAGIQVDTTLGFTDRPGYRAGVARPFHPYDHERKSSHPVLAVPTVLMDTHLYYYGMLKADESRHKISSILDDLQLVKGTACVIWHSHVFSEDHGWQDDYEWMLRTAVRRGIGLATTPSGLLEESMGTAR